MSAAALLEKLEPRGIRLSADGRQLRCRAPKGTLSQEDLAQLAEHKAEILMLLERHPSPEDVLQRRLDGGWVGHRASQATAEGHLETLREGREVGRVDADGQVWIRAAGAECEVTAPVTAHAYLPGLPGESTADYLRRFRAAMPSGEARPVKMDSLSAAELVQHLRQSGFRVSLRPDAYSIEFDPGLLAMPMHVFNAVMEQVEGIRAELREEAKRRPQ